MLERKNIKGLNFLYRLLKGEHKDYVYIKNLLKDRFAFNDKDAFEIAYLYDSNYQEDGDFTNVTDPVRMTYEEYMDLTDEILALMKVTNDNDPEHYEITQGRSRYTNREEIEYEGTIYYVYSDYDDLHSDYMNILDWLCDDPGDHLESYVYMTATDKRLFATDESDFYVDEMTDSEVVERANIEDKVEKLSTLEELKEKLDEIDDEDEYDQIKEEIENLLEELDNMRTYDELIESYRSVLKEERYDDIYQQLSDDVVDYFLTNGYYDSVRDLIKNGPVTFDCDQVKRDYADNEDYEEIARSLGCIWENEVKIDNNTYYVLRRD